MKLGARLLSLKVNQAVEIETSGRRTFIFWNGENHRKLISNWGSDMPMYWSIDTVSLNSIMIINNDFEKEIKKRVPIHRISGIVFTIRVENLSRASNIVSEKVRESDRSELFDHGAY